MKVTVDTNVLVRALVDDDPAQAEAARRLLADATLIAVPVPVFCELAWVLRSRYQRSAAEVAEAIDMILDIDTVAADAAAVEAGLSFLRAGGDFADGVAAAQGQSMGGEVFTTFDHHAQRLWSQMGGVAASPVDLTYP